MVPTWKPRTLIILLKNIDIFYMIARFSVLFFFADWKLHSFSIGSSDSAFKGFKINKSANKTIKQSKRQPTFCNIPFPFSNKIKLDSKHISVTQKKLIGIFDEQNAYSIKLWTNQK